MTNDQQGKTRAQGAAWELWRALAIDCIIDDVLAAPSGPVTGYLFVFNLFACLSVGFQMFARANTKDAAALSSIQASCVELRRVLPVSVPASAISHQPSVSTPHFHSPFGGNRRRQIVSIFVTTDEPRDLISSYRTRG